MNILFFLTPKSEVTYVYDDSSLSKAAQIFSESGYTAIPLISKSGKYLGTLTSNDVLGCITENFNLNMRMASDFPIREIHRTKNSKAVNVSCDIEEIFETIINQNFVPVIDDDDSFIGIITRRSIVRWMHAGYNKSSNQDEERNTADV